MILFVYVHTIEFDGVNTCFNWDAQYQLSTHETGNIIGSTQYDDNSTAASLMADLVQQVEEYAETQENVTIGLLDRRIIHGHVFAGLL